jgi:hypothetical protein
MASLAEHSCCQWKPSTARRSLQYLHRELFSVTLDFLFRANMPFGRTQTEQDIAEIAGAGLNWIRLPIPFWAIETWPGEPFLAKTSWKYVL